MSFYKTHSEYLMSERFDKELRKQNNKMKIITLASLITISLICLKKK